MVFVCQVIQLSVRTCQGGNTDRKRSGVVAAACQRVSGCTGRHDIVHDDDPGTWHLVRNSEGVTKILFPFCSAELFLIFGLSGSLGAVSHLDLPGISKVCSNFLGLIKTSLAKPGWMQRHRYKQISREANVLCCTLPQHSTDSELTLMFEVGDQLRNWIGVNKRRATLHPGRRILATGRTARPPRPVRIGAPVPCSGRNRLSIVR